MLKSSDQPTDKFIEAFNRLAEACCIEAELPLDMAEQMRAIGLSVSHYDDGRWGCTITATRDLKRSNAPLVINTPHKPSQGSHEADEAILDGDTVSAVESVLREAEKYVRGDRLQGTLFEESAA